MTVTGVPLLMRVTISPTRPALLRTLTWVAETTAGPGTSGTVFNSTKGFLAAGFLAAAFFFGVAGLGAGALVGASTAGGGVVITGSGGGGGACKTGGVLVASCASKLAESVAAKIVQSFFFIAQPSREIISGSVNVRHLPGFNSPSFIFPICTRCRRF